MFSIGFTDEPLLDAEPGEIGRIGLLTLGDIEERFVSHFWTWSLEQYAAHWRDSLFLCLDSKPSALVTDMRTPAQSSHLEWWPIWRESDNVIFQNQLLFFEKNDINPDNFSINLLLKLIGKRVDTEDGEAISEWTVSVADVLDFLNQTSSCGRVARV